MAFWGLVLEPKKSYTQREVEQAFHISMAALDLTSSDNSDEPVSVVCRKRDADFILCNLSKKRGIFNVPLNLDFEMGGEINFHVLGNGSVHLTGYIIEDMESFEDSDESMGEEEEEDDVASNVLLKNTKKQLEAVNKRKQEMAAQNKSKKAKIEITEEDDDDEDDSDFDMEDGSGEDVEEEEDDEDDDDEEDDEDDEVPQKQSPKKKEQAKQQPGKQDKKDKQQQQQQQQKGQAPNKNANGTQPQANGVPKRTVEGGVQVEELKVGNGPVAKPGKMVVVYYVGRLKSNNKQFDSTTSGPGFKFRLGRGEVIKGWDSGVAGMKVGGKRRLTIPPKMGYGDKGAGSAIPPNATLVFEVELKNVK